MSSDSEKSEKSEKSKSPSDDSVAIGITPAQSELAHFSLPEPVALDMAVVLEILTDELDVLGSTMGSPAVELRSKKSVLYDADYNRPVINARPEKEKERRKTGGGVLRLSVNSGDSQSSLKPDGYFLLKQHYGCILPRRIVDMVNPQFEMPLKREMQTILKEAGVKKNTEAGKLQADRIFLHLLATELITELMQTSSYQALVTALINEKSKKEDMIAAYTNVINHTQYIQELKRDIKLAKSSKISECKLLKQVIWELRDQLLEIMTLKERETRYIEKFSKALSQKSKWFNLKLERVMYEKFRKSKPILANEFKVHMAMTTTINKQLRENEELLDYWSTKFDVDSTELQSRLDTMKKQRKRDQQRIQWLKTWSKNYKEIVDDENRLREIRRQRELRKALEIKSAIRIQAVWRGTMVRKKLGPFKPQDKKKDKKDKKKDKKGKKG